MAKYTIVHTLVGNPKVGHFQHGQVVDEEDLQPALERYLYLGAVAPVPVILPPAPVTIEQIDAQILALQQKRAALAGPTETGGSSGTGGSSDAVSVNAPAPPGPDGKPVQTAVAVQTDGTLANGKKKDVLAASTIEQLFDIAKNQGLEVKPDMTRDDLVALINANTKE